MKTFQRGQEALVFRLDSPEHTQLVTVTGIWLKQPPRRAQVCVDSGDGATVVFDVPACTDVMGLGLGLKPVGEVETNE